MRRRAYLLFPLLALGRCGGGGATHDDSLVTIVTTALAGGVEGVEYAARIDAVGPNPPLVWRVVGGQLPPGLALDGATGDVTGWPRRAGRHRFTVEVRDGADPRVERDVAFASTERAFDFVVAAAPVTILPFDCAPVQFNAPYLHRLEAVGGRAPYRFSAVLADEGPLPPGLSISADGTIRGIATRAGTYAPTVRATDALGAVAERVISLRVVVLPLVVATSSLPDAAAGFPYDQTAAAKPAGGGPPFRWSVRPSPDPLPTGLTLDGDTGRILGVSTTLGLHRFRLEVIDLAGQVAGRDLSIHVNPGPVLTSISPAFAPKTAKPVALMGQGFQPDMTVKFGGAAAVDAVVLDAERATVVPPPVLLLSGVVDVSVHNPDGGEHTLAGGFRYPLPTVEFVPLGVQGLPTGLGSSRGIAAGDLDGDGRADVVQVWSSGIQWVRSIAGGPWPATNVRTSGSYDAVALADADSDGDLDIVALRTATAATIEVYLNDGEGSFPSTASTSVAYTKPSSYFPSSLATGDVDGDGVVDLALTSGSGGQGTVWVYRGLGDGSFGLLHTASDSIWDASAGCFGPNMVALDDLDGDGRDDLVVVDAFPSACTVGVSCPVTNGVPGAHPGDVDVVAWTARSLKGGMPSSWKPVRVSGAYGRLDGDNLGLALYDHNGDGARDLAVFGGFRDLRGAGIAFLTGDGTGSFAERITRPTAFNRRYGARLDADLDGCDDLVVVGSDGKFGSFDAKGHSVAEVFLGGVSQVPTLAWRSGAEFSSSIPGSNPGRVAVADFDGDGLDDFAVDQSFNTKERFANDQDDGVVEGVAIYLNRSR